MDITLFPSPETKKRPDGIVAIAILWTISSIVNIGFGLNNVIKDLGGLAYLSNPSISEWFRFGLPAELVLNFFTVAFGFLVLLIVYGLWMAKSWSYHFALAVPVFITVINIAVMALYASAPTTLGLGEEVNSSVPIVAFNLIWAVIIWYYLTRPHVRKYLLGSPPELISPTRPPVPPPEVQIAKEEKRFCRYCGTENKTDADFCEKCGKRIR